MTTTGELIHLKHAIVFPVELSDEYIRENLIRLFKHNNIKYHNAVVRSSDGKRTHNQQGYTLHICQQPITLLIGDFVFTNAFSRWPTDFTPEAMGKDAMTAIQTEAGVLFEERLTDSKTLLLLIDPTESLGQDFLFKVSDALSEYIENHLRMNDSFDAIILDDIEESNTFINTLNQRLLS